MYITDYKFTDYYRQYLTFEADGLTEKCKDEIQVNEDDCYALCSCWVDEEGEVMFNVLAIGPSWETCTRGLEIPEMLTQFTLEEVQNCEARIAIPDFDMVQKNLPFIKKADSYVDEDTISLRNDKRFDDIRDYQYPDIVEILHLYEGKLLTYGMRLKEVKGPFLVGEITDLPEEDTDVNYGEITYTLPCIGPNGFGLIRVFGDDSLGEEEEEKVQELIEITSKEGISFDGFHIRS